MDGEAYYQTLIHAIPLAQKRITIASMLLLAEKRVGHILALLEQAIERGVSVTLLFDNGALRSHFIYQIDEGSTRKTVLRDTFATLETLAAKGATVYPFSKSRLHPYRGRCHVKITILDDTVYSFGGINMMDGGFRSTDFMLSQVYPAAANILTDLVEQIGTQGPPLLNRDPSIAQGSILFDGGEPHHSIIYERACELTLQAKHVTFVSQMTPSGRLGQLLSKTDATCYFNRPEQMTAPQSWGQIFDQQRYRITNSYTRAEYIHAKCMLFELPSGQHVVLTGSNNFSYRGVAYGTQEIALCSTDPRLYESLDEFIRKTIG